MQESLRLEAHDEYLRSITPLTPEEEKNSQYNLYYDGRLSWGDHPVSAQWQYIHLI